MDPKNKPQAADCHACGSKLLLRDRYRATRVLGKGGFGTTFSAKDEGLPGQPDCVIKQLKPVLSTPQYVAQCQKLFQREAETLGRIGNHPQIPRLLDYFEMGQEFYLVQEYISGYTLHKEAKRSGPLTEGQVRDVLKEVLPILDYLHQQKVIHRDIKPANVIRREIDHKLILIDFGVVNDQGGADNSTPASGKTDFVVGTKGFAAPEQIAKKPVYASDLYSLGITCVFLLLGKLPKDFNPHQAGQPWLQTLRVSPQFQQVLIKMLAAATCDRYSSAREVLQALEQLGQPADADSFAVVPIQPSVAAPSGWPSAVPTTQPSVAQVAAQPSGAQPTVSPPSAVSGSISPSAQPAVAARRSPQPESARATTAEVLKPEASEPETPQKKSWWNKPILGKGSMTERIAGLVSQQTVSEPDILKHQQVIDSMTTLINKVQKLKSQQFSDPRFIDFVKVQSDLTRTAEDRNSLMLAAELLAAGIEFKDIFLDLQTTEARYRIAAAQKIYDAVQGLFNRNLEPAAFVAALNKKATEILADIETDKLRQAMQHYLSQIELLSQDKLRFQLFTLFKSSQEDDYSILQTAAELIEACKEGDSGNIEQLNRQIRIQYTGFEKLGRVLGIPAQKRLPETYARLIQYVALSDRYQQSYPRFRQVIVLLEKWHKHYRNAVEIRQRFNPDEYKLPKEFKQDLPGVEVYEYFREYVT
ncbi:protein kinase domain-containing protein [Acaryochloris thomasi]|nr:protein kinase [Acaryochloris thomasi]